MKKPEHRHTRFFAVLLLAVFCPVLQAATPLRAEQAGIETLRPAAGPERETLEMLAGYLELAALNNPELEAAFYRWKSALEKIPQAGSLPDPRFTFAYYIRNVETRVGPQQARLALFQTFPWFGVLGLKQSMAAREADAARARYDALKFKVFYDVKNAFYEYAYLAQAVETTAQDVELLRYLENVARVRYTAGAAPYTDLLKMQVQLGRVEDRLKTLQDLRKPIGARLAAAVYAPPDTEFPWPPSIPVMRLSLTDEELSDLLVEGNPRIESYEHLEAMEKASMDLAAKAYYPEITFGLEDIVTGQARIPNVPDSGKDAVIASVTINIPLWRDRRRAAVRESRARMAAASRNTESLKRSLTSDMELALYEYRDAQRKMDLYRNTLIPKAEEALAVTLQGYQAGTQTSLDLIDAEQTRLEFELSFLRGLADQAQRVADLEWIIGREIPCEIHGIILPKTALPRQEGPGKTRH